ncbi:PAS domain-containing protein [Ectothiorhodospira sp. BSL-9]|uniref:PAS domain-containing protein n=1 Tax=Ectothiorhodospira sp. BSL-9 TaxID=1442136 RepID=UPI0007B425E9|nr:PAS domain-containing protein [Ectothiorhodospira sp. BSL-9]ANB02367.1 hypothetical protein ECTOBSL9_1740 [Ectothiorhodospira sp. BSL-9]
MPKFTREPRGHEQLRADAEERLREGTAPPTRGWTLGEDALALLYSLARNPDSASDALRLLHELQTHQVELDLQYQQLEANEQELALEKDRYKVLFNNAPAGYLTVDLDGRVIEANPAGAELLGAPRDRLVGHTVVSFLAPESRATLAGLLKDLAEGRASASSCSVSHTDSGGGLRQLHVVADLSASGDAILMIILPHHAPPGA